MFQLRFSQVGVAAAGVCQLCFSHPSFCEVACKIGGHNYRNDVTNDDRTFSQGPNGCRGCNGLLPGQECWDELAGWWGLVINPSHLVHYTFACLTLSLSVVGGAVQPTASRTARHPSRGPPDLGVCACLQASTLQKDDEVIAQLRQQQLELEGASPLYTQLLPVQKSSTMQLTLWPLLLSSCARLSRSSTNGARKHSVGPSQTPPRLDRSTPPRQHPERLGCNVGDRQQLPASQRVDM